MTRLTFWRDLKCQFESLPESCNGLAAEWNPKGWFYPEGAPIELGDQWEIFAGDLPEQRSLVRLAQRGALGLGFLDKRDAAGFWFDKLRRKKLYYDELEVTVSVGKEVLDIIEGAVVTDVRLASIELCEELLTDSLAEEFISGTPSETRLTPSEANRISADLQFDASVNAIDAEFQANRKSGIAAYRATARALLQTFDVLTEKIMRTSDRQKDDLMRVRLHVEIPVLVFEKAVELQWVCVGSKSSALQNHRRWQSLLVRRAKYAEGLIWPEGSPRSLKSSCSTDWGEFAPLTARLTYLQRLNAEDGRGRERRDCPSSTSSTKGNRKEALENYKARCFAERQLRISNQDVCRVAGYSAHTAIYKWLDNGFGDERFREALVKPTAEFVKAALRLRQPAIKTF